jgi:hypothetical protein
MGAKEWRLETVIMEATAVGMADLVYAANRVLGALVEGVINLYGITRDEGSPATGTVRLTLTGSPTTTIDEGTLFRIEDADSMLVATETVTVTGSTVDVAVATTDTGGYLNAITAGTACDPVVAVPHLANCVLHTDLNGGADAEDDSGVPVPGRDPVRACHVVVGGAGALHRVRVGAAVRQACRGRRPVRPRRRQLPRRRRRLPDRLRVRQR